MIAKYLLSAVILAAVTAVGVSEAPAQTIASKVEYVGTSRHLSVTGLKAKQGSGLLTLIVEVTNSDYDDQEGYYRVAWLDDSGFPAWEEEAWKAILLHGNQKRSFQVIAPTAKATDFKIEFVGERNWAGQQSTRP